MKKENVKHIVITRFNLRTNKGLASKKWMRDRIKLFEKYTLPSVKKQLNKNFEWLLFFDKNTPKEFLKKIKQYSKECKQFKAIFVDGPKEIIPYIKNNLNNNIKYLITSRIDNDDVLHPEFFLAIRNEFNKQNYEYINLLKRYIYREEKKNKLISIIRLFGLTNKNHDVLITHQKSNPFISLIEKVNNKNKIKTVIHDKHLNMKKYGKIIQVNDKPYWIQIIHGENIKNQINFRAHRILFHIYHRLIQREKINLKEFGL